MKKYIVQKRSVVWHEIEILAKSKKEALKKAKEELTIDNIYDCETTGWYVDYEEVLPLEA